MGRVSSREIPIVSKNGSPCMFQGCSRVTYTLVCIEARKASGQLVMRGAERSLEGAAWSELDSLEGSPRNW